MPVTIYHNPQCAKSRATLKLLEDRGLKPNVIEYLKTPPSETEIKHLLGMLRKLVCARTAAHERSRIQTTQTR